jgi:O-antigen/teichoic acid export membrane protein
MASVSKNYILSLVNTISGLLFPIITFPYASRILMADGIGEVNFFTSIISYISLFTCLGIPLYAVREIARVRDDEKAISRVATEILLLHTVLTFVGYAIVLILCFTVSKVSSNIPLFLLISSNIFFVAIGCEWFYQGIEDFQYITIRGLIVKILSVILLFVFVKTKDDLLYYGGYTVIGVVGGNIFNFFRLRKYVHIRLFQLRELQPFRHLKPALRIFVLNLISSIYLNLDTVMLGFLKDNAAVGYYTAAVKLSKMLMGICSSLCIVLLPRLSNMVARDEMEEFKKLSLKATRYTIAVSVPICVGLILMAPTLIYLFCGSSYQPSVITLQILSPIIVFISLSYLGCQFLFPQGKENIMMITASVGAVSNFILNLIFIPKYSHNGAALATLIAEFLVLVSMLVIAKQYINMPIFEKNSLHYFVASIIMGFSIWFMQLLNWDYWVNLIFIPPIGMLFYFGFLFIVSDSLCLELLDKGKTIYSKSLKK